MIYYNESSIKKIGKAMGIESKTEVFPGIKNPAACFEQRATNGSEQNTYYFNQPVIKFRITDTNKTKAKDITDKMFKAMEGCGVGLAHNQLKREGEAVNPYAIFVIKHESEDQALHAPPEAFVNPVIVGYTLEKKVFPHGCLSAIGAKRARVETYEKVLIAFYSVPDLQLQVKKYAGFAAIICQHEFNHLATRGTYIDTVNQYVNGDRFKEAENFYLSEQDLTQDKNKGIKEANIGENLPCLTTQDVLSRCKKALKDEALIQEVVTRYLQQHPEDKPLYDNLMAAPNTDVPLYGEAPIESY
ncbi:peptide deformylase [Candidatus Tisiphia endosymbiont of Nemotelus uliginosus]|uniref:peptide deformylase n=1 Tax=Candidatus Tisiphia endosymbiont of Nemotelus uliginosus TaxID=3077926 RepID=UPI0035C8E945